MLEVCMNVVDARVALIRLGHVEVQRQHHGALNHLPTILNHF
jgi:hypothetical protein